jgi:hypothetical protein
MFNSKCIIIILTNEVDDDDGVVAVLLAALAILVGLVQQKGGHVGRENGRVHN